MTCFTAQLLLCLCTFLFAHTEGFVKISCAVTKHNFGYQRLHAMPNGNRVMRTLKPGKVSATRPVPDSIQKPDYVKTGYPRDTSVLLPWEIITLSETGALVIFHLSNSND